MNPKELGALSVREAREKRLSEELSKITRLSRSAVYGRLRRAHGRTLLRNLFGELFKDATSVRPMTGKVAAVRPALAQSQSDSAAHTIARVRQRRKSDCGVAVVAMLARVPYEEAMKLLFPRPVREHYTSWGQVCRALDDLGVPRSPNGKPFRSWGEIPTTSLVMVEVKGRLHQGGPLRHWVIFQRRANGEWRVIDPDPPRKGTLRLADDELAPLIGLRYLPVDAVTIAPVKGASVMRWNHDRPDGVEARPRNG